MEFKLNESYFYDQIEELAKSWGDIDIDNYGPEYIGRNVLVVVGISDQVATFVLDGSMAGKFTYKLVYYEP